MIQLLDSEGMVVALEEVIGGVRWVTLLRPPYKTVDTQRKMGIWGHSADTRFQVLESQGQLFLEGYIRWTLREKRCKQGPKLFLWIMLVIIVSEATYSCVWCLQCLNQCPNVQFSVQGTKGPSLLCLVNIMSLNDGGSASLGDNGS